MLSNLKYKQYYDQKAKAAVVKTGQTCIIPLRLATMLSNLKYKQYYDQKAKAAVVKTGQTCIIPLRLALTIKVQNFLS